MKIAIHSLFKAKMEANQPLPINVDLDRIKAGLTFRRQLLMYLDALKVYNLPEYQIYSLFDRNK